MEGNTSQGLALPPALPHPFSPFFSFFLSFSFLLPLPPWPGPETVTWGQAGALPAKDLLCPDPGGLLQRENPPSSCSSDPDSLHNAGPPAESHLKLFGSSIRSKEALLSTDWQALNRCENSFCQSPRVQGRKRLSSANHWNSFPPATPLRVLQSVSEPLRD